MSKATTQKFEFVIFITAMFIVALDWSQYIN